LCSNVGNGGHHVASLLTGISTACDCNGSFLEAPEHNAGYSPRNEPPYFVEFWLYSSNSAKYSYIPAAIDSFLLTSQYICFENCSSSGGDIGVSSGIHLIKDSIFARQSPSFAIYYTDGSATVSNCIFFSNYISFDQIVTTNCHQLINLNLLQKMMSQHKVCQRDSTMSLNSQKANSLWFRGLFSISFAFILLSENLNI
jgi:hypothetical protein